MGCARSTRYPTHTPTGARLLLSYAKQNNHTHTQAANSSIFSSKFKGHDARRPANRVRGARVADRRLHEGHSQGDEQSHARRRRTATATAAAATGATAHTGKGRKAELDDTRHGFTGVGAEAAEVAVQRWQTATAAATTTARLLLLLL